MSRSDTECGLYITEGGSNYAHCSGPRHKSGALGAIKVWHASVTGLRRRATSHSDVRHGRRIRRTKRGRNVRTSRTRLSTPRAGGARPRHRVHPPTSVSLRATYDAGWRRATFALGRGVCVGDRRTQLPRGRQSRASHTVLQIMVRPHAARTILLVRCRFQQQQHARTLQLTMPAITLHRTGAAARDRRDSHADLSHRARHTHVALHRSARRRGWSEDTSRHADTDIGLGRDDPATRTVERRGHRLTDHHTDDN